ncbi:hypothetical protein PHYBLDRAFT_173065 [Phycomyces blakesleeanus NRRL 1555(-)]|uniref:Uncharacterized protein n=1 Tax=Phycomyces blakesleeanus (strain ATCC 8743b / DSM 1359 / FGSC 10004 / NBRC 33097 / NRRL 1555) TaxID=763407 RepID=A0A167KQG3_PHYB8|nr:hypothetical protein PHYBLDRAFT_173065 [Phycomyces blakesleeanus NRRL 1555(-)]OAD68646.1 hypothetical protein PHYBLDRAFT_173065 [Phycomyces blakesleeanus NRRL 1555(-)]|eukprot:XP_018286686.1 hypothetical protein PHYBLDRAFT_173065 [Phycomyces blakesleeanus NRRL 1555(-)]
MRIDQSIQYENRDQLSRPSPSCIHYGCSLFMICSDVGLFGEAYIREQKQRFCSFLIISSNNLVVFSSDYSVIDFRTHPTKTQSGPRLANSFRKADVVSLLTAFNMLAIHTCRRFSSKISVCNQFTESPKVFSRLRTGNSVVIVIIDFVFALVVADVTRSVVVIANTTDDKLLLLMPLIYWLLTIWGTLNALDLGRRHLSFTGPQIVTYFQAWNNYIWSLRIHYY